MSCNLLYYIPNFSTAGSGLVVNDLLNNINKDEFNLHLLVNHNKGQYFKDKVSKLNVHIHVIDFQFNYRKPLKFLKDVFSFIKFLKRNKIDIVHSWEWSSNIGSVLSTKLARVTFIYTKKSTSFASKSWKIKSRLSSGIIAISNSIKNTTLLPYSRKVEQIYIGIDTKYYSLNTSSNILNENVPYILCIANVVPIKGIEFLLDAFNLISDEYNDLNLLILGNNQSNYGEKLIKNYSSSRIIFVNRVLDVRPFIQSASIVVLPTRKEGEGLGVSLIESMSMETISIGSDVNGIKEVLQEFPNHLFRTENVDDLANKLNYFLQLPKDEITILGKEMRKAVKNRFSLNNMIEDHEIFYRKVLKI